MPPNSTTTTDGPVKSSLGLMNPEREKRDLDLNGWFTAKSTVDGAEGLWRIHDSLYDLTDFVRLHPGGSFWLEATKNTDITEAFETHHISTKAENILQKFHVRDVKTVRNSPYLFKEDGFYKTLKRSVREELEKMPKDIHKRTDLITDASVVVTILTAVLANVYTSYTLGLVSGIICGMSVIAGHNYIHRKDNFRMYYMDLFMSSSRDSRIAHVLSHHMYTNTILDIQAYTFEPILVYFPQKKSWVQKLATAVYAPLLIWPLSFPLFTLLKLYVFAFGRSKALPMEAHKEVFLSFILPTIMFFTSGQSLMATLVMWMVVECTASFFFGLIAFTMGHFHPDIFIDGDEPRPKEDLDWGVCQLDAVCERYEITGNIFLVLLLFGDHAGHHLFPTLDVAAVQYLMPAIEKVMKQFNLEIRWMHQTANYLGYLRRVAKETPNPNPPDLHKVLD